MAKHHYIDTSADRPQVLAAFDQAFLTRPAFKERFTLSKKGQLRSSLVWERQSVPGADIAARLVAGGLREMMAASRNGPGSQIGTVIALSVEPSGTGSVGELWLADYPTFMGMNQMGDVLKAYAKLMEDALERGGADVALRRG